MAKGLAFAHPRRYTVLLNLADLAMFSGHQIFHLWIRFELLQQLRLAGYFKNSRGRPFAAVRLYELRDDPLQEPVAGLGVCAAMGG
jgi:hypothetical protein